MIDWAFVLAPLAVLPIVLLFRFVGCGTLLAIEPDLSAPRYRDFIMNEPNNPGTVPNPEVKPDRNDIIGYWRLVDDPASTTAKDETGQHDGSYVELGAPLPVIMPVGGPVDPVAGSDGASGLIGTGNDSLISTDNAVKGRVFIGGHVVVPDAEGLHTDDFSLEAWIEPQWGTHSNGFDHVLFSCGGHYARPFHVEAPDYRGFTIYADYRNRWQVHLRPESRPVTYSPPQVPRSGPTHLVVTVEKEATSVRVAIFVDGKQAATGSVDSYLRPDGAPLFIAVGNANDDPAGTPQPTKPAMSGIQEVVLYRRALRTKEVENHFALNPKKV